MLEQDELIFHVRRAKLGDESSKEIIFKNNELLLKSIIRRFKGKGVEYDDLYQIASIGLLKAIVNFDESFNVKFSTYTVPMVIGEIKRYMRDNGAVKVSRSLKILANKINKYAQEYQTKHNESPSIESLAKVFNVSQEDIVLALDSIRMPLSLYDKCDDEKESGLELIDKIADKSNEDDLIEKIELDTVLNGLNERERKIMVLRFYRDKTQTEVAQTLGVSQVQVSRLESKIIEKMRKKL